MSWELAGSDEAPAIERLILEHEPFCVSLSSRYFSPDQGRKNAFIPPWTESRPRIYLQRNFDRQGTSDPRAIILLDKGGLIFPLFPESLKGGGDWLRVPALPPGHPLGSELAHGYSCMGLREDCDRVIRMGSLKPSHRVEYLLMTLSPPPMPGLSSGPAPPLRAQRRSSALTGIRIRRAGPDDAPRLIGLQMAYEREEVLLPGRNLNEQFCFRQLQKALTLQRVLYIEINGEAVAKAQTNARGRGSEQLGGIYTHPRYRGQGLASSLVRELSREILAQGKSVSLFVKPSNASAIRVYRNCGFSGSRPFSIFYL